MAASRFADFSRKFVKLVKDPKKKVIIGGYDLHGAYCNWLLERARGREADMIIDDELCSYGVRIFRELKLDDLDPEICLGVVPFGERYAEMFKCRGIETVYLPEEFGCEGFSYYEWLEGNYGCDFMKTIDRKDFDYDFRFATNSGASRQMGLMDVLDYVEDNILFLSDDLKVLDVGCGKGGAIELFSQMPFAKVDGIELSKSICSIARKNMELLGNDADVMNVSATQFDRYEEYDILYLYDPFRGEVFRSALRKIEEAARKRRRPMMIIYANPYHHKDIVDGGVFKQISSIDTDFFHRTVKVYSSEEV